MSKIKKILVKSLLCLSLVMGITIFVSDEAYAYGDCTPHCTCAPGEWGRSPSSGWIDYRDRCDTYNPCEVNCDGHVYGEGPGTENCVWSPYGWCVYYNEWDDNFFDFFCYHKKTHHIAFYKECAKCPQWVGETWSYDVEWRTHDSSGYASGADNPYEAEPCKYRQRYWNFNYCSQCQGMDTWCNGHEWYAEWWDHHYNIHWAETAVNGDRSYHALWCNRHGWVNSDDCENHPQSSGSYAGLWYGVDTTSGVLKYYYHNLSSTNYGDSMHYKCTDCGHTHSLACTLTSTMADNNAFIGKSNINDAFIPGANDAWTNTNVKLTASQGNSIINKNTSAWLGSPQTITQEGTNIFYTYMSGHGNAVTSKEHYVKIDKTNTSMQLIADFNNKGYYS